jgi:hypothetical protein
MAADGGSAELRESGRRRKHSGGEQAAYDYGEPATNLGFACHFHSPRRCADRIEAARRLSC